MKIPTIHAVFICAALLATPARLPGQPAPPAAAPPAAAVPAAPAPLGPRMTFLTNDYNFGKAMSGSLVKYVYIVSNAGDETLVISNVAPGCHCTTAAIKALHVEPGKTGEIPIQFDSNGARSGGVTKTIMVTSNSKLAPNQSLVLRGTIWKAVEITPQYAYISVMPDAPSNSSTVVHIVNNLDDPITLSNPTSSTASFKAELKIIKPGKDFQVTITALPPLQPGNNGASISIKTSLTNMPAININVNAMVQPAFSVVPPQISLMPQIDRSMTNRVTITANGSKALALSDPEVSDKRVSVELKEMSPGRVYQIAAIFPPGFQIAPGQEVQVSIKSNNEHHPVIVVPIRQYARQPVMAAPLAHPTPMVHPKVMSQSPPPPPLPTTGHP